MKRILAALMAGAAVFTIAFASAAALGVNGNVIQAGVDSDVSCDTDGVNANWGLLAEILKEREEPAERLQRIFQTVLARRPDATETARYLGHLARHRHKPAAYEDVYWTLLNSAEFFFNH